MPWKETCQMDQRLSFIVAVNESEESIAALCRRFGISRKTGYKWMDRYELEGPSGLEERAPVARTSPHRLVETVEDLIVALRKEQPTWGPKKLRAALLERGMATMPAVSTVGEVLKRNGLIRPRRRRVRTPPSVTSLTVGQQANDVWCVDFKGDFALGDKTRCYPLTITDHATRYLLKCEALTGTKHEPVRVHFERVFREFGMPSHIRSDNGVPFASTAIGGLSPLSVWWMKLGITPERIEPGKPQQNGRHERMHRTLKQETATPPQADMASQQRAFDRFRHHYNDERPHEALDQKTPSSRYFASRNAFPAQLSSPVYPDTMKTRRLDLNGKLSMPRSDNCVSLGRLLAHEPVGLEQIDDDRWEIFYGTVLLGEIRIRNREARLQRAGATKS